MSDFEEIDRYKLNADHILGDLYNVQKLAEWDLDAESETALMQRYSDFVALLPNTYKRFNRLLIERKHTVVLLQDTSVNVLISLRNF